MAIHLFSFLAKGLNLATPVLLDKAQRNHRIINLLRSAGLPLLLKEDFDAVYAHTLVAYNDWLCQQNQAAEWVELLAQDPIMQSFKECWQQVTKQAFEPQAQWVTALIADLQTGQSEAHLALKTAQQQNEQARIQAQKFYELFVDTTQKSRTPAATQAYNQQYAIFLQLEEIKDNIAQVGQIEKEKINKLHQFIDIIYRQQKDIKDIKDILSKLSLEQWERYIHVYYNDINGNNNLQISNSHNNTIQINVSSDEQLNSILLILNKNERLQQQAITNYRLQLQTHFNETVLNDPKGMTLADVYIQPHFAIHRLSLQPDNDRKYNNYGFYSLPDAPLLHDFVSTLYPTNPNVRLPNTDIIAQHNAKVILLLGDPGQGKSSFCKHLLQHCLQHNTTQKVFFIALRYVTKPQSWLSSPIESIIEQIKIDLNRLTPEGEDCTFIRNQLNGALIVLDGLDELCMIENMDKREAEAFCKELLRESRDESFKILITSRYGYIDAYQLEKNALLLLQLSPFSLQQQQKWLYNYQLFHPETRLTAELLQVYNNPNQYPHLAELLDQAILLHIIATLQQDIDPTSNRGSVYQKLFDELCQANWKQSEGQLDSLQGIQASDLREILQRIAFTIYQNQQTYITPQQLQDLGTKNNTFRDFVENKRIDFNKTLLMASYMRRSNADNNPHNSYQAIEFLHKSLQEYLTAEYIWQQLKDELGATSTKGSRNSYSIDDIGACLKLCDSLFTPQSLLPEESVVKKCLIDIINNDTSTEKTTVGERLQHFWTAAIPHQFLYHYSADDPLPHNLPPIERIQRNLYAYWLCLKILLPEQDLQPQDPILRQQSEILWQILTTLNNVYTLPLDLSHQNLSQYRLRSADLRSADLRSADLRSADLRSADLRSAHLIDADLSSADLSYANLRSAYLRSAYLINADLRSAYLINADLRSAYLINADLSRANLSRADLRSADLRSADLRSANLINADLSHANLSHADLSHANLRGTDLSHANLSRADLSRANLSRANLSRANLSHANLSHADLRSADLSSADLRSADLTNVQLDEVKVERADWLAFWSQQGDNMPKGVAALATQYEVDHMPQTNVWGETYYVIRKRQ